MPSGPPPGGFPAGFTPPPGMKPPAGLKLSGAPQLVLTDVKIEKRPVTTGVEGNDSVEIKSGLKEGDQVVVATEEPKAEEAPVGGAAFGGGMPGMGGGKR